MKTELSKIAEDLEQGTITEDNARNLLLGLLGVSESFRKSDLLELGGWFDGCPEFVEEVVNDWLNAR